MKNKNILAFTVLAVAGVSPVSACDCCSIYSACNAHEEVSQGFVAGLSEQFTHFGTVQDNDHEVHGEGQYIDSLILQIFAGYNFNERFGVQFNLPVIYRSFGADTTHGTESGIGDVSLVGNFRIYQKSTDNFAFNWMALGGIKFPTGDSSRLNTPDSALPEGIGGHDLAPGSGSFDGLVGTSVFARWKKLFFTGQMQYAIRTEGDFQHRYANDWTWSAGPGVYLALKDNYSVALQIATTGESKGKDTFGGTPDTDSATAAVYLGPQINFTWSDRLSAQIGADLPMSIDNTGTQVVADYRIHAAVTWRF